MINVGFELGHLHSYSSRTLSYLPVGMPGSPSSQCVPLLQARFASLHWNPLVPIFDECVALPVVSSGPPRTSMNEKTAARATNANNISPQLSLFILVSP